MAKTLFPISTSEQILVLVVSGIFLIITPVAIGLRILARYISKKRFDNTDYTIIGSWACSSVFTIISVVSVIDCGVGVHVPDIEAVYGHEPIAKFLKLVVVAQILWAASLILLKISILLLYSKIFMTTSMIWATRITGGLVACWALTTMLMGLLLCRPLAKFWDPTLDGTCGDPLTSSLATGIGNLLTDILVLVLPIPHIWALPLRIWTKVVLALTLAGGFLTCAISVMRVISLTQMDVSDITYSAALPFIWGNLEPNMGIILACIPFLRPLLGKSVRLSLESTKCKGGSSIESRWEEHQQAIAMANWSLALFDDNSSQAQLNPAIAPYDSKLSPSPSTDYGNSSDIDKMKGYRRPSASKGSVKR